MKAKVDNLISSYNRGDITLSALIKQAAILASEASTPDEVCEISSSFIDTGLIGYGKRAQDLDAACYKRWRELVNKLK